MSSVDQKANACIISGVKTLQPDGAIDSDRLGDMVLQFDPGSRQVYFLSIGLSWKPFLGDYAITRVVPGTLDSLSSLNVGQIPDCVGTMLDSYQNDYLNLKHMSNDRLSAELCRAKAYLIRSLS